MAWQLTVWEPKKFYNRVSPQFVGLLRDCCPVLWRELASRACAGMAAVSPAHDDSGSAKTSEASLLASTSLVSCHPAVPVCC